MTRNGGKGRALALATALLAAGLLFAASARAAFDDLGAGARAPGMGNAFTAIADDVYAMYYNPAGLALLERPALAASHTQHLIGLSDGSGINTSFLGYAHPLKWDRGTVGAGVQSFSLDGSLYNEQAYYLSYAREVPMSLELYDLFWGVNLKNLRRSFGSLPEASNAMNGLTATGQADPVLSGKRSLNVFDADLGLLYKIGKGYTAGLTLMHLATPNVAFSPTDTDKLPLRAKLGLGYGSLLSNVAAQYDTARGPTGERDHRLTMAAERWFPWLLVGNIGARAAMSFGSRDFRQFSAGLSYRTGRIGVDYGFVLPINSIASTYGSHRLSFSIRFGPAREEEESVKLVLAAMRSLKSGLPPALEPSAPTAYAGALKARLDRARFLESEGRYPEASSELAAALELSPQDPQLLKHQSRLTLVSSQLGRLEGFRTDSVKSSLYRSALAFLTGSDEEAVSEAAAALALKPDSLETANYLAQVETATGLKARRAELAPETAVKVQNLLTMAAEALEEARYDEAVVMSEAALKHQPGSQAALENLGIAYFAQGEYEKSLEVWRKSYRLETGKARQAMIRSQISSVESVMKQQKRRTEAAAAAASTASPAAAPARPAKPDAQRLYREALDLYSAGELLKAKAAFQKVLDIDPGNVPAANAIKRIQRELR